MDPIPRRACVAVLTAPARGALGVVRVWGPDALSVADAVFRPSLGPRLAETQANRPRLGRAGGGRGDEVVAVVTEDHPCEVEIHTHGGPAPLALVLDALVAAGARGVGPEEWIQSRPLGPTAADAEADLARATTLRTAEILLDQRNGSLDRELADSREASHLDRLLQRAEVGLRLTTGWSIALAGRPNVGKSALLNALAGYERAIVDPTPGTTRDVVSARTAIDGWPVEILDTAGLRASDHPIESAGIALAREHHRQADLVVLVLDRSEPLSAEDHTLQAELPDALVVANKSDRPATWTPASGVASVSARTGEGLAELMTLIARRLVPDSPEAGAGVPFRLEHLARIRALRNEFDRS